MYILRGISMLSSIILLLHHKSLHSHKSFPIADWEKDSQFNKFEMSKILKPFIQGSKLLLESGFDLERPWQSFCVRMESLCLV